MQRLLSLALFSLIVFFALPVLSQEDTPPPVEVSHIAGPLHLLRCNGNVAVVASVGPDGILLVDSGYGGTAEAVGQALNQLGRSPVRVIVNTHGDGDHVGGNAVLGKDAMIISHPAARVVMGEYFSLPAAEVEGFPNVTIENETTIYFNHEKIKLMPVPGGHTPGDLVVHFEKSKVACLGDIVLSGTFPNADPARGGNAQVLSNVLKELSHTLPEGTTLVPGHGATTNLNELQAYIAMVDGIIAAVRKEMAAGHSLEEILTINPLAPWAEWEVADVGLSFENLTTSIAASLGKKAPISICAPLTKVLVSDGVKAAVKTYQKLKMEEGENWNFDENELNMLGYQLLQRGRSEDAIEIFKLNVEAFPEGFNTYDSLGEAYLAADQKELAIKNYKRSLELNPENNNAKTVLEQIQK